MGIKGEVPFFAECAIELSPMFGFGHGIKKTELLHHATIKTIHLWPSRLFRWWF